MFMVRRKTRTGPARPLVRARTYVVEGGRDQLIARRYPRVQGTTRIRRCPRFVMGSQNAPPHHGAEVADPSQLDLAL
jgi:hypothetical protein